MDNNYIHRDIETVISEAAKYFPDLQSDLHKGIAKGK